MMDKLRAASNNVVLKIILGLIIVSFVLTGVSGYLFSGSQGYAAKVNGQEISISQFRQAVQNDKERLSRELGEKFAEFSANEELMKQHRAEILNSLIDDALLEQYAEKLNLAISDQQVKDAIRAQSTFQVKGAFDNNVYQMVLRNSGITGAQYAEYMRKQLIKQQLSKMFVSSDFSTPSEIESQANLLFQKRDVRLAKIDLQEFINNEQATDAEVDAFYKEKSKQFMTSEKFKISYIELDAVNIQDNSQVTPEEIKTYYEQNLKQFGQVARYHFSFIQLKTEDEAKAIVAQLQQGADFATLAKEKSQDPISAKNGGELGWFEEATMADEIKQAKLTKAGQISEPIKSSVGYLVIRLNELQPAKTRPLSEVSDSIASQLAQDKSKLAYFALQQKVGDAIRNNNDSLQAAEQAAGVKAVETDWFDRTNIPKQLAEKELTNVLFNGSLLGTNGAAGPVSDLITVPGDRAYVLRITEHKPEAIQPLNEVRSQIVNIIKQQKARDKAIALTETALSDLKAGKPEAEVLQRLNIQFAEPHVISRMDQTDPFRTIVFDMPQPKADKPTYALETKFDITLIALDRVEKGEVPEKDKESFKQQLTLNNSYTTLEQLLANLRKQGDVKINTANSDI